MWENRKLSDQCWAALHIPPTVHCGSMAFKFIFAAGFWIPRVPARSASPVHTLLIVEANEWSS